jgi:endogenous inhibitor of DNA gyrase (YacG/DUF329 family)
MRQGDDVACESCGRLFHKPPSCVTERNFCSDNCRLAWFGKWTTEVLNVQGHSAGHKAPHLTELNQQRNPAGSLHKNTRYVPPNLYRAIAEEHLGRKLRKDEVVHHINGDRSDNRIENLQVMTKREHAQLHMKIAVDRYNKEVM